MCRDFCVIFLGGGGGVGRREGMVDDFCQARKAENTDPRTNYAVKYATARGRLRLMLISIETCNYSSRPSCKLPPLDLHSMQV